MKKALLTLILTLLALPVYCSTADELQEALDDLCIEHRTYFTPHTSGNGSYKYTSAKIYVDEDTIHSCWEYQTTDTKKQYYSKRKAAVKDFTDKFELGENYVIFKTKAEDVLFKVMDQNVKEFIKKMKNIIKLSKKLEEEKNAPSVPEDRPVPADKNGKK